MSTTRHWSHTTFESNEHHKTLKPYHLYTAFEHNFQLLPRPKVCDAGAMGMPSIRLVQICFWLSSRTSLIVGHLDLFSRSPQLDNILLDPCGLLVKTSAYCWSYIYTVPQAMKRLVATVIMYIMYPGILRQVYSLTLTTKPKVRWANDVTKKISSNKLWQSPQKWGTFYAHRWRKKQMVGHCMKKRKLQH